MPFCLQGWINEPCPAQWMFGDNHVTCEYVLHGVQSQYTCCPHGLTTKGPYAPDCGCRDDLTETPYRMAYQQTNSTDDSTTYTLNLALVEAWRTQVCEHVSLLQACSMPDGAHLCCLKIETGATVHADSASSMPTAASS